MNKLKRALLVIFLLNFCHYAFSQTKVYMQKENGIFMIPCEVNGIPMNFIFDTGASNVSMSKTESNLLMKQNLLGPGDILGVQEYQTANGDIVKGKIINLKTIRINDIILSNIKATVIPTQNAPLLLGQNVISKLGGIEINGNRLTINSNAGQVNFKNETNSNQYLETKFNQFLGIDLTKKPTDFNPELEKYSNFKKDDFIPYSFDMLGIKDYQLKSYKFDKKRIAFKPDGQVQAVVFAKKCQNKTEAQNIFKKLKEFFEKNYNSPDTIQKKTKINLAKWKFNFYVFSVFLKPNNNIGIMFGRSVYAIKNFNRQVFTDWINEKTYNSDKELSMFARFEDETLHFYREIKSKKSWEGESRKILEESHYIEGVSKIMTKELIKPLIQNNQAIDRLKNCYIDQIKFTTQFYFSNSSSKKVNKTIYWNDLKNLPFPFTEEEFAQILH